MGRCCTNWVDFKALIRPVIKCFSLQCFSDVLIFDISPFYLCLRIALVLHRWPLRLTSVWTPTRIPFEPDTAHTRPFGDLQIMHFARSKAFVRPNLTPVLKDPKYLSNKHMLNLMAFQALVSEWSRLTCSISSRDFPCLCFLQTKTVVVSIKVLLINSPVKIKRTYLSLLG